MRISQIVRSSDIKSAKRVHAFTEQSVAMLSSVLRSERAIEVNIAIMRAFVQLREMLAFNVELARKLRQMEKKYDEQFKIVFEAIRQLMTPPEKPRKKIGFEVKEKAAMYGSLSPKRKRKLRRHEINDRPNLIKEGMSRFDVLCGLMAATSTDLPGTKGIGKGKGLNPLSFLRMGLEGSQVQAS